MALTENNIELLEQYIDGKLSEEDKKEVAQRISSEPEFKAAYDELKPLMQGIRYRKSKEMLELLREEEQAITGEAAERQAEIVKMQPWKRILTMAAVLVGLIIGGYLIYLATDADTGKTSIYASYFEPAPPYQTPVIRGKPQVYTDAFDSYNQKNYESAINYFETYLQLYADPDAAFYLAISYMVEDMPGEAIRILEEIRTEDFEYQDDAKWYLALAYINNNQPEKAQPILDQLANSDNEYTSKANQVLKEL